MLDDFKGVGGPAGFAELARSHDVFAGSAHKASSFSRHVRCRPAAPVSLSSAHAPATQHPFREKSTGCDNSPVLSSHATHKSRRATSPHAADAARGQTETTMRCD